MATNPNLTAKRSRDDNVLVDVEPRVKEHMLAVVGPANRRETVCFVVVESEDVAGAPGSVGDNRAADVEPFVIQADHADVVRALADDVLAHVRWSVRTYNTIAILREKQNSYF